MEESLRQKYRENPYMTQRLESHLSNLPVLLEQEDKRHEERVSRMIKMTQEQETFCKVFLSKHAYFYMPYNDIYYKYNGKTYSIIEEDEIHDTLFSTINRHDETLIPWKHKTKTVLLKKIRKRGLFQSTPETYTIQHVLAFLQSLLYTKLECKYFLTVLGDCIGKKNEKAGLLYFVSSSMKKLLGHLDKIILSNAGISIMGNFITKFHESHTTKLDTYRLIRTTNASSSLCLSVKTLYDIGIDLCCVATHYSARYGSADDYLRTMVAEETIQRHICFFVHNSLEDMVEQFQHQYLVLDKVENKEKAEEMKEKAEELEESNLTMSWKNMHYLWKHFLSSMSVPNVVYSNVLQECFTSMLPHRIDHGGTLLFTGITSKYLPSVGAFLSFWEKYITITGLSKNDDNVEKEENKDFAQQVGALVIDEYEIDEIMSLYQSKKHVALSDEEAIKIITHYFSPQVEVVDNKYLIGVTCSLWLKHDDLNDFLQTYRFRHKDTKNEELISTDELYEEYKAMRTPPCWLVSKQCFENFILCQLHDYVQFDKLVSSQFI